MEPKYYVYTLSSSLTGQIFYVGKGTGNRWLVHEREARLNYSTNPHKIATIRKIWDSGGSVVRDKIFLSDSEEIAYQIERETIRSIGLPNLTNITEGGDGVRGEVVRLRQRQAVSTANAKVWDGFIDPWGFEFYNIRNLWQFCEDHDLHYQQMILVSQGKKDHHKGWRKIGNNSYYIDYHLLHKTVA